MVVWDKDTPKNFVYIDSDTCGIVPLVYLYYFILCKSMQCEYPK